MKVTLVLLIGCLLNGCAKYAEFTLPPLRVSGGTVSVKWNMRRDPVLTRGPAPAWDSVDALNPSVFVHGGKLWNVYSGYDGTRWHSGSAVSEDGVTWTKLGKILSPDPATWEGDYIAANGAAIEHAGSFWYWYQGGSPPQIGLAQSSDGSTWKKRPRPVLPPGPRGSWDERGVADPYVIQLESNLYMYYLGQDRARRQRLGVARSSDGLRWEKLRSNPVLELGAPGSFDELGLGEPAIWQDLQSYWMLYTGRDKSEHRRISLARSQDGVHWTRYSPEPVLSGSAPWNAAVVCDATVLPGTHPLQVWFGGGDRPQPAENLNGQIGFATLELSPRP